MNQHPSPDPLDRLLANVPEADPPPQLWTRLQATRTRQLRRRRTLGIAGTATLAAVFAAGIGLRQQATSPGHGLRTAQAAQTQPDAVLQDIDRQLQLAYARSAPQGDIEALWRLRRAATERAGRAPIAPVGI